MKKTELEQHDANKKEFMELMPLLRGLNEDEANTLIHKLKNSVSENGDLYTESVLNDYVSQ